ncbi:hypothetical protein J8281_14470 [Aquimarina sp. U1-2]|uniref:hypothetical protein n=1 Tax=Aquimarina sp. U1-2 TaxID=2823141 RepID=UPI001AECD84C|nr:hypothetical protein [Aquimarina sp. U1-2]MBP2833396.1 hypothetical protein [Aquimarina sp. U1-2]
MKTILLVFTLITTSAFTTIDTNEVVSIEATYSGQSDDAYYFTNKETGKAMKFAFMRKEAVSKYDLNDKKIIGSTFTVTYEIEKIEVQSKSTSDKAQVKEYKQRLILIDLKKSE